MRILFITQIIPYPLDAGPKIKTWNVLRYLSELGHKVILASFIRPEAEPFIPEVRKVCEQVHTVPIHRSRLADIGYWLQSQLKGRPFLVERDDIPEMRNLVKQLIETEQIDVIHADQLTMAQYSIPPDHSKHWPMTVFDTHNAVWSIVERTKQSAFWLLKPVLGLEAKRIRKYEAQIVAQFDHTLAVSDLDKDALVEITPEDLDEEELASKITVIPIGIDTNRLKVTQRKKGSKNILTMGTLHYPPNADGIRWFINEVFPLVRQQIPEACLTIAGKNPPSDFLLADQESDGAIKVMGYVPNLTPLFEDSAIMVVPVRVGGGMRVRILEAFARAMPVVTTTIGLEGIEAQPGIDVLVEDEAQSFAEAVINLINNEVLQDQLAENGRRLAESHYNWHMILRELNRIYQ